jgi:GntR family transcriptional regulator, phosphonate transport system regulatory protein
VNTELRHGSELPLYMRIAVELRQNVKDGVYRVGQRIPTEESLSLRFGVNRHTLRRAISMLAQEGLLRVDQGRGTFVAEAPIRYPIGERVRFNESLKAQGWEPRYQMLRIVELPAGVMVAEGLEIEMGEGVVAMERLGLADGWPIKVATSYFALRYFPDILRQLERSGSISLMFREVYGCDHLRRCTTVSAQMVAPEDARLLALALNQPVLQVEAINVDQHGRVIEYGVTRFRSDRTELVIEPSR